MTLTVVGGPLTILAQYIDNFTKSIVLTMFFVEVVVLRQLSDNSKQLHALKNAQWPVRKAQGSAPCSGAWKGCFEYLRQALSRGNVWVKENQKTWINMTRSFL